MKRAIVLSGGGAKGAYELGVWKALRKLGISYDIVTGTSIGALNAIMMVQNTYAKCLKLWYFMNYDYVSSMEIKGKYSSKSGRREIISKYTKGALTGGYEMDGLSKVIDYAVNPELFFNSKIEYGLVTTYFPSFKGKFVTKKDLTKDNLKDYLLATASCYPAFKPTKIDNNSFVDGGYTDNMPINLAIDLGADEIIAVDLRAIGMTKKIKDKSIPITYIKPSIKLGSLLVFEKDYTRSYLKLGYNDTLKVYGKCEGNKYTFKLDSLRRNYDRNGYKFYDLYNSYSSISRKIPDSKKEENFNNILESLLEVYEIDPTKIYRTSLCNVLLRKELLKNKLRTYGFIKKKIVGNKRTYISKELIKYIYNELGKSKSRNIKRLKIAFPKAFMCAVYLKVIER